MLLVQQLELEELGLAEERSRMEKFLRSEAISGGSAVASCSATQSEASGNQG